MKKILLLLLPVLAITGIVNAQDEGYSWYFPNSSSSPFASSPAVTGSAGSYDLIQLGSGVINTTGTTDDLSGFGGVCGANSEVAEFTKPVGFEFSNSPQYVGGTYTIEMVINIDGNATPPGYMRLVGFNDLALTAPGIGDNGIYIEPGGNEIQFASPVNGQVTVAGSPFSTGVWYHLLFIRNGATKIISYYKNGVFVGDYNDNDDSFVPNAPNNFKISFLKDDIDDTEETSGKIAKISVINRMITPQEIEGSIVNICNPAFQLSASNFSEQGYQWTFPSAVFPYTSVAADAASTASYDLNVVSGSLGAPTFTHGGATELVSAGCGGPIEVATFTKSIGLQFFNDPHFVANNYSIEMDVNLEQNTDAVGVIRLVGFTKIDPLNPTRDNGIYYDPTQGGINFYSTLNSSTVIPDAAFTYDTWYHLMFVRNSSTKIISYYRDAVLIGTFADNDDLFVPQYDNSFGINFLKDDEDVNEETNGMLAKIAIFNKPLTAAQVQERFDNVCNANLIILPVSLVNFTAKKAGTIVNLTWTTASEQNNTGFEVQRSTDGTNFVTIGFVNGNGTTSQASTYNFTDQSPSSGKNYYRLKQVDANNRVFFSAIRLIDLIRDIQALQVYPNPAHNAVTVTNLKSGSQLSVFDSQGRSVLSKRVNNVQEQFSVEKMSTGIYIIQVTDSNGAKRAIRFTKF